MKTEIEESECCEIFPLFAMKFTWMSYDKKTDMVFCMPNMDIKGTKYRINHCPSCGKEVRNFEISRAKLQEWTNKYIAI